MADDTAEMPVGIGHNQGPELPTTEMIEALLLREYGPVLERTTDLLAAETKYGNVSSDEADSEATEFMVKVRTGWKTAEAGRVKEKAPYDNIAGQIHAFFKTRVLDPLQEMGGRINDAQTLYKRGVLMAANEALAAEERKRRAAEAEAKRIADEAAEVARQAEIDAARARKPEKVEALKQVAAAAKEAAVVAAQAANTAAETRYETTKALAAPAADKTRSRGGRGGVSSLAGTTSFRDLDGATVDLEKLRDHIEPKALASAMNSWIKANKGVADKAAASVDPKDQPIKGVVIYTDYQNRGRS